MKWSLRVGSILGIPLRVHLTFVLLLIFIALSPGGRRGAIGGPYGVLWVLLVFGCVVLHELSHSITARHYGIRVRSITLLPIGGVSQMGSMPESPRQEFAIAVAGPALSFILALAFRVLGLLVGVSPVSLAGPIGSGHILVDLFRINLVLGLFNLAPAFPLDGGRALKAVLSMTMEPLRATRLAVTIGQVLAGLLFILGVLFNWWLALIAIFIYLGAEGEERAAELKASFRDVPVSEVMIRAPVTLRPDATLREAAALFCHSPQNDFAVVEDDRVVGVLGQGQLLKALHEKAPDTPVHDVMVTDFPRTVASELLAPLYRTMVEEGLSVVPVLHGGRLLGLVTLEQIGKYHLVCGAK
jgi:Zn-dependent protease/predicted transcriptional regulator